MARLHLILQNSAYDGGGNQIQIGGFAFTYDAENRLIAAYQGTNSVLVSSTGYVYDGDGHRVQKIMCPAGTIPCNASSPGASLTTYAYDAMGQLVAEYGTSSDSGTNYLTTDHLGSTRLVTDSGGTALRCYDYLPFGQEIAANAGRTAACFASAPDADSIKFTGKERDAETDLDYFGFRYLSAAEARFLSVDPAFESEILELSQTWNRYSYVYNRPLSTTDPDGRCPPRFGALVGGVLEGAFDFGKQLVDQHGDLSKISVREVGANILGGAVAGALAVATGGTSLFASGAVGDLFAGTTANVIGGIVTRAAAGKSADEVLDLGSYLRMECRVSSAVELVMSRAI